MLGIGYRTVRDVACLFNEDIIIDDITDNICISECFRLEIEKYKAIEIIPNRKNIDNISNLLSVFDKHNPELDHISATVKCCYKRAVDLVKMYDLDYCKFLFWGDHDFTSLAFAMLCKNINKKPHIVVMDIDENVLSYIKQCSQKNGYDIETYYSDFRFVIPKNLIIHLM